MILLQAHTFHFYEIIETEMGTRKEQRALF